MASQPCLPRPWVCESLELIARARRRSSSTWLLPSRGSLCRFSRPCSRCSTFYCQTPSICFSLFAFLTPPPCVLARGPSSMLPTFLFACYYLVAYPVGYLTE